MRPAGARSPVTAVPRRQTWLSEATVNWIGGDCG